MEITVVLAQRVGKNKTKKGRDVLDVCINTTDIKTDNPFDHCQRIISEIYEITSHAIYDLRIRVSEDLKRLFSENTLLVFLSKIRQFFSEKSNQASFVGFTQILLSILILSYP